METNTINIDKKKLVTDIKQKSELQRFYKNQRKTKHLLGERKMQPDQASWKHAYNRYDLRIMYVLYGLSKGKTFSQIENRYPEEEHPLNKFQNEINKIKEKYEIKITTSTETEVIS